MATASQAVLKHEKIVQCDSTMVYTMGHQCWQEWFRFLGASGANEVLMTCQFASLIHNTLDIDVLGDVVSWLCQIALDGITVTDTRVVARMNNSADSIQDSSTSQFTCCKVYAHHQFTGLPKSRILIPRRCNHLTILQYYFWSTQIESAWKSAVSQVWIAIVDCWCK